MILRYGEIIQVDLEWVIIKLLGHMWHNFWYLTKFRVDALYLVGWTWKSALWYSFDNKEHVTVEREIMFLKDNYKTISYVFWEMDTAYYVFSTSGY